MKSDFPFLGSFGGFSFYKMRGSEKTIVRRKGGPSAEKMKTSKECEGSRKQQTQFGGSSTAAKMIRAAMPSITHLADFRIHSHFLKLNAAVQALDLVSKAGQRSLIFSRALHLFEGVSLNRKATFDSVVITPVVYAIHREEHKAVLQLPALSPKFNFISPWNYPFYRFRINLGIVRDMVFTEGHGYEPITPSFNDFPVSVDTEWAAVKIKTTAQQVELQLDNPVFDEHCNLVLSIGIELGSQSNGIIEHVPYAGCGKILAMG